MVGNFFAGLFGKTDAEITETVFFDVSIGGQDAGRIEMGLYGETGIWIQGEYFPPCHSRFHVPGW